MNTSRRDACQTSTGGRTRIAARTVIGLCAALFFLLGSARFSAAQLPPPAPTPPPWQQELDALRLLEASLLVIPVKEPSETVARDQRLSQLYRNFGDKYPDRAVVQKGCADYARRQGRTAEAMALLQRAQRLEPGDADTADLLGSIHLQLGRTREAGAQFQRAVDARPDNADYHYSLANTLYLFRHDLLDPPALPDANAVIAKSLVEFRRAAELAPGSLQYAQSYAETFYAAANPDWEQARQAWRAVLALSGANGDFANAHLARVSLRLKQPEAADAYLTLITNPGFDTLKAKLHEQAIKMPRVKPPATP